MASGNRCRCGSNSRRGRGRRLGSLAQPMALVAMSAGAGWQTGIPTARPAVPPEDGLRRRWCRRWAPALVPPVPSALPLAGRRGCEPGRCLAGGGRKWTSPGGARAGRDRLRPAVPADRPRPASWSRSGRRCSRRRSRPGCPTTVSTWHLRTGHRWRMAIATQAILNVVVAETMYVIARRRSTHHLSVIIRNDTS